MSEIELDITPVAEDIVEQLKSLVPVRTGRLRDSIRYAVREVDDGYIIELVMEDYFKWLKVRRKAPRLPTARELAMARPPLPKMNTLGRVPVRDLSPRSKGIMEKIDYMEAVSTLDKSVIEEQIKDILMI